MSVAFERRLKVDNAFTSVRCSGLHENIASAPVFRFSFLDPISIP